MNAPPPVPLKPRRLSRTALLHGGVLAGAALAMCFLPLFDLLGYESSLVLALLSSVASMHLGVAAVAAARRQRSVADGDAAEVRPLRAVLCCWGLAYGVALLLLVPPLCLLLLNGLRVRNCDYLAGLSFFLIMPVASAACGAALGTVCGLLLRRRRDGVLLGVLLILLSILWAGWRFLSSPAIFAYDPFFGYFPGALYDEEITIELPFYAARLYQGAWALAALAGCAVLLDGATLRVRALRWRAACAGRGRAWGVFWLALGGAVVLSLLSGALGIQRDVPALRRVLSAEARTAHFVLRYTPGGAVARDLDLLKKEHELRYEQIKALLQITPAWSPTWLSRLLRVETGAPSPGAAADGPPVISYLFESARQKQQLMGAAHTFIAKPWRREIYLQHEAWPHPVLKHELAHIFAGAAGDPVLHIALRGIIPNQGLIEGVAEAADWPGGKLTLHQAVKAMREAGIEPPLGQVLGLSFLSISSGRAYTVAGSFCRYLLDRFGPARLLRVYHEGGGDAAYARAYGLPLRALADGWRRFIDEQKVAPAAREVERERVRRPPVFYKVCAHELALRQQQAYEAQGRGDMATARRLMETVCHDDPAEPRHLSDLMDLLWSARLHAEAAEVARTLADPVTGQAASAPVLRAHALALLGDQAWMAGDIAAARRDYQQAQDLPNDEAQARLLTAKRLALDHPVAGPLILRVLIGVPEPAAATPGTTPTTTKERDAALDLYTLAQAAAAEPLLGLGHYLLARQLYNHGAYQDTVAQLGQALDLGLPDARFEGQAGRLLGQALLLSGQPARAQAQFSHMLAALPALSMPAPPPDLADGQRVELTEWIDRARRWPEL